MNSAFDALFRLPAAVECLHLSITNTYMKRTYALVLSMAANMMRKHPPQMPVHTNSGIYTPSVIANADICSKVTCSLDCSA